MNKKYIEYDGDNEKPKNRFKIASTIFLILFFPITFPAFYPIKYLESGLILMTTVENFAFPIFLIIVTTCYKNYLYFEKNTFKTKVTFLYVALALTALILGCIGSTIVLTNNYFGSTPININGTVVDYSEDKRKRKHITIYDKKMGRNIDLKATKRYKIGEKFTIQMKKGFWGFLYTTE